MDENIVIATNVQIKRENKYDLGVCLVGGRIAYTARLPNREVFGQEALEC